MARCRRNVTDLVGSLVTSSRPPGQPEKRRDDRTSNADVAVRTADGSRRTVDAADEQCLRCTLQRSIMHCSALCCRYRWTVPRSLYCTGWGTSSQCSSSCRRRLSPRWYFRVSLTTRTAAFSTRWSLSVQVDLGDPARMALQQSNTIRYEMLF